MALSDGGAIYVGSRGAGNVYALQDLDNDEKAATKTIIASDLDLPSELEITSVLIFALSLVSYGLEIMDAI